MCGNAWRTFLTSGVKVKDTSLHQAAPEGIGVCLCVIEEDFFSRV